MHQWPVGAGSEGPSGLRPLVVTLALLQSFSQKHSHAVPSEPHSLAPVYTPYTTYPDPGLTHVSVAIPAHT